MKKPSPTPLLRVVFGGVNLWARDGACNRDCGQAGRSRSLHRFSTVPMSIQRGIILAGLIAALGVMAFAPFDYEWRSVVIDAANGGRSIFEGRAVGQLWAPPNNADVQEHVRARALRDTTHSGEFYADVDNVRPAWGAIVGRLAIVIIVTAIAYMFLPGVVAEHRREKARDAHVSRGISAWRH